MPNASTDALRVVKKPAKAFSNEQRSLRIYGVGIHAKFTLSNTW